MALVFDNAFVQGHVLATRFLSDLDTLCKRDYKGVEYFHKTIDCLDMDAYESSLSGDNDATMDASIGVATYENNRGVPASIGSAEWSISLPTGPSVYPGRKLIRPPECC